MDPDTLAALFGTGATFGSFGAPQMPNYYPSAGEALAGGYGGFTSGLAPGGALPTPEPFPVSGAPPVEAPPTSAGGADGSGSRGAQAAGKGLNALAGVTKPAAPSVQMVTQSPRQAEFHAIRTPGLEDLIRMFQVQQAARPGLGQLIGRG